MTTVAAKKTAYVRTRIRPQIKRNAERVFQDLGISMTDAISVFFRQVALQKGLPFDVKVPNEETQAALREDASALRRHARASDLFDDILGKEWRKK